MTPAQVLKRVGQECEAHRIVYWTAASVGDLFQVRTAVAPPVARHGWVHRGSVTCVCLTYMLTCHLSGHPPA